MKYYPDLIPEKHKPKIEINQYLGQDNKKNKQKTNLTPFFYIIAVFFVILFLSTVFTRFFSSIFFLGIGLIMLPAIHNKIEKTLRFTLNWKIKSSVILILFIPAFLISSNYIAKEKEIAKQDKIEQEIRISKEKAEKEKQAQIEQMRVDSLNYYTQTANELLLKAKYEQAFKKYEKAKLFTTSKSDFDFKQGQCLSGMKKFDDAIAFFSNSGSSDALYERAICYQKTGKIQEAVNDLKKAIELGNPDAEKLHNKINPILRKIIGYNTLCCDGTTSDARGRGACSSHGGVCNWNNPIYQEYRKY
jgi:tetratricopeptide (TPR) repeat protein